MNVLCVEYPGYGIYQGQSTAENILQDAEIIFDFMTQIFKFNPENIILYGRSIGSGPTCHLANVRSPGMIILMSPFTSIRNAASNICGKFSLFLSDRFKNIEKIKNVKCPVLIIHGKKDTLIPYEHAI